MLMVGSALMGPSSYRRAELCQCVVVIHQVSVLSRCDAHVLLQHAQSKIGSVWRSQAIMQRAGLVRDSSMAANVA